MIEIIPAIDLIDGQCVRLKKGDYSQKTIYEKDPLTVAKRFEDNGIRRLHLVDLDGAKARHVVNDKVLERIASNTNLTIDFGGGVKTDKDIERIFNAGAEMVTVGSIAVQNRELFNDWLARYGGEKIILGADIKENFIAISGWYDVTDITLEDFLAGYIESGVKNVLCTDITKDGMLEGTALELYDKLQKQFPQLYIIASGGISDVSEIRHLNEIGVYGVIIGKALYEGRIKLEELKEFL